MGKKKPKKGSIAAADPTKTGKDTQGKNPKWVYIYSIIAHSQCEVTTF